MVKLKMCVETIRGLTFFLKAKPPKASYLEDRILKHDNYKKSYVSYNMTDKVLFPETTNVRAAITHNAWFRNT